MLTSSPDVRWIVDKFAEWLLSGLRGAVAMCCEENMCSCPEPFPLESLAVGCAETKEKVLSPSPSPSFLLLRPPQFSRML